MLNRITYVLLLVTCLVLTQALEVELLDRCGETINLPDDSNGYLLVKDSGNKPLDCEVTIKCSADYLISTRFLEINFPSCGQSELEFISILGPETSDQYSVFQSQPHFCGKPVSDAVDFEQYGEQEWRIIQKTKPKGEYSYAAFSFTVHKTDAEPKWPSNQPPTTTPTTAPTTAPPPKTTTTKSVPTTMKVEPTTTKAVPTTTKAVPTTIKVVPTTTKAVPTTTAAVPITTPEAAKTTASAMTTESATKMANTQAKLITKVLSAKEEITTKTDATTKEPATTIVATKPEVTTRMAAEKPETTNKMAATKPELITKMMVTKQTEETKMAASISARADVAELTTMINPTKKVHDVAMTKSRMSSGTVEQTTPHRRPTITSREKVATPETGTTKLQAITMTKAIPTTTNVKIIPKTSMTSRIIVTLNSTRKATSTSTPKAAPTTTPTPKSAPTTTPTTEPTHSTTTQSPPSVFRCSCPVAISDRNTKQLKPGTAILYLEKSGAFSPFDITVPASTCDSTTVVERCKEECHQRAMSGYGTFGPNTPVPINNDPTHVVGDMVCQRTLQMSGALTVHSHVLECPKADITPPVRVLDREFYCYRRAYCSSDFRRQSSLPYWSRYRNCPDIISSIDTEKRKCSCLLGMSETKTFELKMAVEPISVAGPCEKVVSECKQYCQTEGKKANLIYGTSAIVERMYREGELIPEQTQINDLLCEKLELSYGAQVESRLYSQVNRCKTRYVEGASSDDRTVTEVYKMSHRSRCY